MTKVIVITSGKGGVGKTTTSCNIASGLALRGKKVAVIDFDVGLRNLDLIMGVERRVVYDFINVIHNEATLKQALIKDKRIENLYILAASQTRDKTALTEEGVAAVIDELKAMEFDYVVCDSPAGIETGAFFAMYFADEAIVVTNPEVSSVRDSDRIIGILESKSKLAEQGITPKEHLLITRYDYSRASSGDMLEIADIQELLALDLIGIIPEAKEVLTASNSGEPLMLNMELGISQAYMDTVDRILGQDIEMKHYNSRKKGLFQKIFS